MSSLFDTLRERLGYVLSLPERTLRSLAALAGGTTSLLSEMLFPDVLRDTTLYKIFVGDTQRFVIEKVAEVKKESDAEQDTEAQGEDYLQRKMIGGALETAGLFAMHFSPLWVFALAGDAASGGQVFLDRLVEQLKRNRVLAEDAEIKNITELFVAMQEMAQKSATNIDTPPLTREEVTKAAQEMTESYKNMFAKATNLIPRLETIWQKMQEISRRENISIERVSGILTVDVASWGKKGIAAVLAVGQTGSELFGEKVLDSYANTLDNVTEQGVTNYLNDRMNPFLKAAAAHFNPDTKTWTESMWNTITGEKTAATPPSSPDEPSMAPTQETPNPEDEIGKGI